MKRIFRWVGIGFGGLMGVVIVALAIGYFIGTSKVNKTYDILVADVVIPTDEVAVARGRHLVEAVFLCAECHAQDLGGELMEDDPVFGIFAPRNLTSGRGGIGGAFSDADYVRAIRHGLGQDGKSLVIMPSEVFYTISDSDLGAIIAHLKGLPPVDNELPLSKLRPLGRIFAALDSSFLPASVIDHDAPRAEPEPGVTEAYGAYLATTCRSCHGESLSGGTPPGGEPGAPKAPNLTSAGSRGAWTEAQFMTALRTGTTPSGNILDSEFMPWLTFTRMTDDELSAIWLYLESLPPKEFGK